MLEIPVSKSASAPVTPAQWQKSKSELLNLSFQAPHCVAPTAYSPHILIAILCVPILLGFCLHPSSLKQVDIRSLEAGRGQVSVSPLPGVWLLRLRPWSSWGHLSWLSPQSHSSFLENENQHFLERLCFLGPHRLRSRAVFCVFISLATQSILPGKELWHLPCVRWPCARPVCLVVLVSGNLRGPRSAAGRMEKMELCTDVQ